MTPLWNASLTHGHFSFCLTAYATVWCTRYYFSVDCEQTDAHFGLFILFLLLPNVVSFLCNSSCLLREVQFLLLLVKNIAS